MIVTARGRMAARRPAAAASADGARTARRPPGDGDAGPAPDPTGGPPRLSPRRRPLGPDRPGDAPRHRHDRDHRVDAEPGRERRAVGDVEARDRPRRPAARTRPRGSAAWSRGVGAHPDRAHLVGREDARRGSARSPCAPSRSTKASNRRGLVAGRAVVVAERAASPTARISTAPAARARRAIETEGVAERRDARPRRAGSRSGRGRPGSATSGPRRRRG